jgi:hypothetical protein
MQRRALEGQTVGREPACRALQHRTELVKRQRSLRVVVAPGASRHNQFLDGRLGQTLRREWFEPRDAPLRRREGASEWCLAPRRCLRARAEPRGRVHTRNFRERDFAFGQRLDFMLNRFQVRRRLRRADAVAERAHRDGGLAFPIDA